MRQTTPKTEIKKPSEARPAFLRIDISLVYDVFGIPFGRWQKTEVIGVPHVSLNADALEQVEIFRFEKQRLTIVIMLCSSPVCE